MDEELENIRLEKAELESEKLRINEKNKLLWEQSAAIHHEKECINQLRLEVEEALQIAVYQKEEVQRQKEEIEKQKKRSDELLLNILPEQVAEELKERGEAEAKLIDKVTVLFTDFKGFTQLSEKL
ncbi:MAG: hypothetical protein ACKO7B_07595, partial [Flavobacteriales bacterium]